MDEGAIIRCSRCNLNIVHDRGRGRTDKDGNYICLCCVHQEKLEEKITEVFKIQREMEYVRKVMQYETRPLVVAKFLLAQIDALSAMANELRNLDFIVFHDEQVFGRNNTLSLWELNGLREPNLEALDKALNNKKEE